MIRVQIKCQEPAADRFRSALRWMRDVEEADDGSADAVIADSLDAAADSPAPCLLLGPERCAIEALQALAGGRVMPAHPWRFRPDVAAVHESLASGELGRPGLLRVHRWLGSSGSLRPSAFHQVDLARWFFGAAPTHVHVLSGEDCVQLHFGFPSGGMAVIGVTHVASGEYFMLHLLGSNGAAYGDDHHNKDLFLGAAVPAPAGEDRFDLLATEGVLREFVAGLRDERAWSVSIEDSLAALAILKEVPDA